MIASPSQQVHETGHHGRPGRLGEMKVYLNIY